jgi:flagellar biosynthesis GTPase FlhF
MPPKQRGRDKKVADDGEKKRKSKILKKGGGGGGHNDRDSDSDVDSHGNVRGLIDYDYSSEDSDSSGSYSTDTEELVSAKVSDSPPPVRRAALIARKKIKEELREERGGKGKEKGKVKEKEKAKQKPKKRSGKKAPSTSSDSNYTDEEEDDETESVSDSESESESSDSEPVVPRKRKASSPPKASAAAKAPSPKRARKVAKPVHKKHHYTSSEDESDESDFKEFEDDDEDDDEEDIEDTEDEDDEDEDDEDEEDGVQHGLGGNLILTLGGGGGDDSDRMVPQRYNMKKEPESVRKFVKLVTAPMEDNTIDAQIDQFKALTVEKQNELLTALERRPTITDSGVSLMLRILTLRLPTEIQALILAKYNSLQSMDPSTGEYFKLRNWLDKVVSVPFGMYKEFPIRIDDGQEACSQFMVKARKSLDDAIYGQDDTKLQILQYMSTKIANPGGRGMNLLLVGPPGIGKTSLIKHGIAKALDWPFQFISLGGDSDASTYNGHQLVYESSHCGKIVNSLVTAKSMSTILLFDEVDKVSSTPKGEEVQNLLVHLTDPAANGEFEDKYLAGVPIDLSRTMFIFSANDITKIDKILLDRLLVIELKGYELDQKLVIAENYILPAALQEVNLTEKVAISKDILKYVIETYAREEAGVRELKRCIEQIVQKLNLLRMYNARELPFHIPNFSLPFVLKREHIDLFLKKKESTSNGSPFGMYL